MSDYGDFRARLLGRQVSEKMSPAQVGAELAAWIDANPQWMPHKLHIEAGILMRSTTWEEADKARRVSL